MVEGKVVLGGPGRVGRGRGRGKRSKRGCLIFGRRGKNFLSGGVKKKKKFDGEG